MTKKTLKGCCGAALILAIFAFSRTGSGCSILTAGSSIVASMCFSSAGGGILIFNALARIGAIAVITSSCFITGSSKATVWAVKAGFTDMLIGFELSIIIGEI